MDPMRPLSALVLLAATLASGSTPPTRALPAVRPNPNVETAGALHDGVLTVALEAKQSSWRMNGENRRAVTIEAFSEAGKPPVMPAPLIRVVKGTEIRLSIRNSLPKPLTFFIAAAIRGVPNGLARDSVVVAPGAVGVLATRAAVPGNYVYAATTPGAASKQLFVSGVLAGAVVIDTANAPVPSRDRVFVIMMTPDSTTVAAADTSNAILGRFVFTINGRSWPNTERIAATAGDSLHWRIINASADVHPMHLHGFYYRVDGLTGPLVDLEGQGAPGRMVATERLSPFSAMSMSWSPDRPGNWILHCHFAIHLMPDSLSMSPDDPGMTGMVGLILGINVAPRPGIHLVGAPSPVRHLRLVAIMDKGFPDSAASMRFVLEEQGRRTEAGTAFSPAINLTRGVPVSITVVNHLSAPTSVHWHGIELEDSYMDGVPGVTGAGKRLSPAIAPSDSFEARFTPPRSGTFMYHAHVDEVRQQSGGLVGALLVRDPGAVVSPDEHVFFLKASRLGPNAAIPLDINGEVNPDTVVLHMGRPARLRFISLSSVNPNATVWLTARRDSSFGNVADTMVVRWRPVAKDGADLPANARGERLARQIVSMGETYDFEYTPGQRGILRLEVRTANPPPGLGGPGQLLVRVPIRVE
jgi:FtsP/CotA-like multicopper oxidase with cupredoxin domain